MAGVYIERASSLLFSVPPASLPGMLPAPTRDFSLMYPFNISLETYHSVMDIRLPITIASIYATTVWGLGKVNKRRGYEPWGISRSRLFTFFVVAHNIALALFSAWIHVGMFRAISETLPSRSSPAGAAAILDALCKMHGPRGYGNAVFFDPEQTKWTTLSRSVRLSQGAPDTTELGRLWNEGLGYYGWIFYLSKFYEVIDTLIILAKGKKSSLLQTYHHAGAMIGMWAGMRYMSPPIWCFVIVNSFIHTVMYSYYAASAMGFRVPMLFKRTLTTMQIIQLLFGASYALVHLIIAFDVPVEMPYLVTREVSAALPRINSAVLAAATSAGVSSFLKKLALRAAGDEGLARNVGRLSPSLLPEATPVSVLPVSVPPQQTREEIKYRWETTRVHCVDTSGEVLAILLNVFYLMPLTYLFVRFFVRSYLRRAGRSKKARSDGAAARLRASGTDAVKGIEIEIRRAMKSIQGSYSDLDVSGTPGSSAPRSTVDTPLTTSAPRSGTATPPTVKPLTSIPVIEESTWLGSGKGASKGLANPSPKASPPASPSPASVDQGNREVPKQDEHLERLVTPSIPKSVPETNIKPESASDQTAGQSAEVTDLLGSNTSIEESAPESSPEKSRSKKSKKKKKKGVKREEPSDVGSTETATDIKVEESLDRSGPAEPAKGIKTQESSGTSATVEPGKDAEPDLSADASNQLETVKNDGPRKSSETSKQVESPAVTEQDHKSEKTESIRATKDAQVDEHHTTSESSEYTQNIKQEQSYESHAEVAEKRSIRLDGTHESENNDEVNEQMERIDLEDSFEDITISSLTVPRASSSPTPSEAQRNAEETVRRAYEAADMATLKASEDDADSILSVETTFTIESMANGSRVEARRYEIPGVDEALDPQEQEAESELQPAPEE